MALREFIDGGGISWQVWNVRPSRPAGVGRRPERRVTSTAGYQPERRRAPAGGALGLAPGLESGWLCFESPSQKRRLMRIPDDWETCAPETLEQYCTAAEPVRWRNANPATTDIGAPPSDPALDRS